MTSPAATTTWYTPPAERTHHTEISTAAELRRRAVSLERTGSAHRFYGMTRAADRQARIAIRLRALAALVECAPFEAANTGPAMLARMVGDQVRSEIAAEAAP